MASKKDKRRAAAEKRRQQQQRAQHVAPPAQPVTPPEPEQETEPEAPLVETRADVRLVGRAVRERWPISNATRAKAVKELGRLVEKAEKENVRVFAANVLVSMDRVNVEQEKLDKPPAPENHSHQHLHAHAHGHFTPLTPEQRSAWIEALVAEELAGEAERPGASPTDDGAGADANGGNAPGPVATADAAVGL